MSGLCKDDENFSMSTLAVFDVIILVCIFIIYFSDVGLILNGEGTFYLYYRET